MESAYRKWDWAKQRARELADDISRYRDLDPIQFRQGTNTHHLLDPSLAVVRFYARVDPPMPDWWGLAVGDVLGNLRAALDHALVFHVRRHVPNLTEAQERRLNFPILIDDESWQGTAKAKGPGRSLRDLCPPGILDAIKACQPFVVSPDRDPHEHPLAVLNRLVNIDKHREISVVAYVPHELTFDDSDATVEYVSHAFGRAELTDGALAGTITVRKPAPSTTWQAVAVKPTPLLGFVETIRIDGLIDDPGIGVLTLMDFLIDNVKHALDEIARAGG